MKSSLAFQYAQQHVDHYQSQHRDLMAEHREAMDCRDCEAFLQLGIDAFDWLMRADRLIRSGYSSEELEYDAELESALARLCKAWLGPCEYAELWIAKQVERGYSIDNAAAFRQRCLEMQAIVEFDERGAEETIPKPIARLRDEALDQLANGETAEFV